ncbi:MAG: ferritin family protein [Nitrospirae bacterium]|nr:ferritin family protein [Nitrospirota bacterium]MBI4838886.1 ferritin family protein [Nitrospirota bacterium]
MNVIEVAMKMETDAIKFYSEAAGRIKNNVGRKMFLTIAKDEERHLENLSRLLKGFLDQAYEGISPVKNVKTVFKSMRDEMMQKVGATADELEAFKIAMQMEKEGIAFYKKTLSDLQSKEGKSLFERLVKEEEEHYNMFSNTYSFLSDTGNWFMWEEHGIVDGGTPWA